jgi:uncharacterized repeat protein (TIGR04138 family)
MVDLAIFEMTRTDNRYAYEAYEFVCDSVGFTQERLDRAPRDEDDPEADYHISGEELLRGCVDLAILEFGMMATLVFKHWGIQKTDDIGQIVFNLIEINRLSQSDRDDMADFVDVFDLHQALQDGFQLTIGKKPRRKEQR